jgi:hypothetical protein
MHVVRRVSAPPQGAVVAELFLGPMQPSIGKLAARKSNQRGRLKRHD